MKKDVLARLIVFIVFATAVIFFSGCRNDKYAVAKEKYDIAYEDMNHYLDSINSLSDYSFSVDNSPAKNDSTKKTLMDSIVVKRARLIKFYEELEAARK